MPVQRSQGRLRPVAPRADELPVGVAAAEQPAQATPHHGRITTSDRARELGAKGGRAKAGRTRLAAQLTLSGTLADPRFAPYERSARAFRAVHVAQLARDVGGGVCGPAPSSIIASASLQLAASRFAFEILGDLALGSRLADASRANLLSAHELVAREAQARAVSGTGSKLDWFAPKGGSR